jgi:hypothetical protein
MQSIFSSEYAGRAVFRFGVDKRPNPLHRVEVARLLGIAEAMLVILAADVQRQPVAGGYDNASGQDLDMELDRLAGDQWPFLIVRMVGAVRQASLAWKRCGSISRSRRPYSPRLAKPYALRAMPAWQALSTWRDHRPGAARRASGSGASAAVRGQCRRPDCAHPGAAAAHRQGAQRDH